MKKGRTIIWDEQAEVYLKSAIKFIRKDSPQNAEIVKEKILDSIGALILHPEKHALDKYHKGKKEQYRAFEIYRFRIAYSVSATEIRIVRIRHSSQEPLEY